MILFLRKVPEAISECFYTMPSTTQNTIIPLYHPFYSSRDKNSILYNGGEIKPPVILKKVGIHRYQIDKYFAKI